jgi:hypothetical protein
MAEHNLFYYSYASLLNTQLPLLKVAVPYFGSLVIFDPGSASWATIGTGHHAQKTVCSMSMAAECNQSGSFGNAIACIAPRPAVASARNRT